jgi:hypothetical protein
VLTLQEATRAAPVPVSPSAPLGAPAPARGPFGAGRRPCLRAALDPRAQGVLDAPAPAAPVPVHQRLTGPPQVQRGKEAFSVARVFFGGGRAVAWIAMRSRGVRSVSFFVHRYSRPPGLFFFSEFRRLHPCGGQKSQNRPANGSFKVVTVKI